MGKSGEKAPTHRPGRSGFGRASLAGPQEWASLKGQGPGILKGGYTTAEQLPEPQDEQETQSEAMALPEVKGPPPVPGSGNG